MIVMHIESGLGNQMLDYADFLAAKKANPGKDFYLENLLYSLPEVDKAISMWNGYELEKIFGIYESNFSSLFSEKEWHEMLKLVQASEFWNHGWTFSKAICDAYQIICGNALIGINRHWYDQPTVQPKHAYLTNVKNGPIGTFLKRKAYKIGDGVLVNNVDFSQTLFSKLPDNCLSGHWLLFNRKRSGIELIEKEIRKVFSFPELDDINSRFWESIQNKTTVSIHARRGDMLSANGYCYKYGFFKRSVRYIKERVTNPVFVFFTNEGSVDWCKSNLDIFGLAEGKDNIMFVTWNTGLNSFRDMQLMSLCNHNIITESSFGWWGAFLNQYKDKITCSPDIRINTTNSF